MNPDPHSRVNPEPPVPEELSRLWRLPPTGNIGRPAQLDVERVVRAAIALADDAGLAGATLPKIAEALGYSTMSLYRHVRSKDELLTLMLDAGLGMPPEITTAPAQWQEGLRRWARAMRAVYSARPWLIDIPISGPPSGPHQIAWFDSGLGVLRELPANSNAKIGVLTLISGYVRQMVTLAADHSAGLGDDPRAAYRAYGEHLARLVHPDRFPYAAEVFAAGGFTLPEGAADPVDDVQFDFGLGIILRGVAATGELKA